MHNKPCLHEMVNCNSIAVASPLVDAHGIVEPAIADAHAKDDRLQSHVLLQSHTG